MQPEERTYKSWADLLEACESIDRKIDNVAFAMEYLKDPEDALIGWNAPADVFHSFENALSKKLIEVVSEETGADPEQLAEKESRTEAQERALLEAGARFTMGRIKKFTDSIYFRARLFIGGKQENGLDQYGVISVSYFFALHPEIDPRNPGKLTEEHEKEILGIFERLSSFVGEKYPDVDINTCDPAIVSDIIHHFSETETPAGLAPLQLHQLQKVSNYNLNNTKVFHVLGDAIAEGQADGQLQITLSPDKKTNTDVVTYLSLTYQGDDNVQFKGRKVIIGFDKAVYNAVSTLYAAGNRQVSAQDIYRTMNGNTKKRPSTAQVERITNSIRKWMYTALYMDMSQELQRHRLSLDDDRFVNGRVETQMLQATIGEARTENGRTVTVFKLAAEPIMYTYCKSKKQILTVPISLLDTSEATSNTEGLTAIREYLLQQIELMRNGYRNNKTIRYSTIYEETDVPEPSARKDAMRLRNQIKAILETWKERDYIKGYSDAKNGTQIVGIVIDVEPHKK